MIVIVTGGRDYADNDAVIRALDALRLDPTRDVLYYGGATGADALAHSYCARRCITTRLFAADWKAHGRAAGPIRNQTMIDTATMHVEPARVVAFPGGRGTADCVRRARAAGLDVVEVSAC